jgi:hypothetical protein
MREAIKMVLLGAIGGALVGVWFDYTDTKTMGVGMHYIQSAKAECERSGRECAMIWEFVELEADYE